ncbi:MAG: EAL domain-containing protein [Planctomycetota bacterium]
MSAVQLSSAQPRCKRGSICSPNPRPRSTCRASRAEGSGQAGPRRHPVDPQARVSEHRRRDRSIAGSVIDLGHTLGMEVIAEGVESTEQLEVLRSLGCDLAKGYLLGHPEPAEAFQRQYLR